MISEIPFPPGISFLGRHGVSVFSLFLMLSFFFASYFAPRELRRRGLEPDVGDWCILITIFGAIIGSKVFFVFEVWSRIWIIDLGFWDTLYRVFFTWAGMHHVGGESMWGHLFAGGGLVFYGGFLFSFAFVYSYLRIKKLEVWKYADVLAICIALGYGIGRLGCFFSGDGCFGYASSGVNMPLLTWVYGPSDGNCPSDPALAWKYPYMCTAGVRVWNTPFIEAFFSLTLFFIFLFWGRKQKFQPGMLMAMLVVWNAVVRFSIEFLRLNDAVIPILESPKYFIDGLQASLPHLIEQSQSARPESIYFLHWRWYGFTQSQIVALLLGITGIVIIISKKLYKRDNA